MMEQTNHSTDTLLASFQAGNMAAFSQLYNLHINVLFNYGLKLTIDKELLKDCIHDIFVKLYTKKDELGTIDNLRSYLFISLKNKLCDELRRRMYMSDTAVEEVSISTPMIIWKKSNARMNFHWLDVCSTNYLPANVKRLHYII